MSYQVTFLLGGHKLIPAPRLRLARSAERSADGTVRRRFWQVTVLGQVAAFAGSPRNDGTFWDGSGYPPDEAAATNDPSLRIRNLRNKLGALAALFEAEPLSLEVIPGDGSASIRSVLRPGQFTYADGPWFNAVDFTLEAEADTVWFGETEVGLGDADQAPEEAWALEPADEFGRAYRLTHTVACTSRKALNPDGSVAKEGWERARDLVEARLGFDQAFLTAAGLLDLDTFRPHNYLRSVQQDKAGGRVAVTETWTCVDPGAAGPTGATAGRALEELTVETRFDRESGRTQASVTVQITGLEERDPVTRELVRTRYANASLRLAAVLGSGLQAVAEGAAGVALNPSVLSSTVGKNAVSGVVTVTRTWDSSPALPDGFLSYEVETELENAADVFAEFVVPGRGAGPLFQPLATRGRKAVTVSASLLVPTGYGQPPPAAPAFDPLPVALRAIGGTPAQLFLVSDRPRFNERRGAYSRSTTYVFQ